MDTLATTSLRDPRLAALMAECCRISGRYRFGVLASRWHRLPSPSKSWIVRVVASSGASAAKWHFARAEHLLIDLSCDARLRFAVCQPPSPLCKHLCALGQVCGISSIYPCAGAMQQGVHSVGH